MIKSTLRAGLIADVLKNAAGNPNILANAARDI